MSPIFLWVNHTVKDMDAAQSVIMEANGRNEGGAVHNPHVVCRQDRVSRVVFGVPALWMLKQVQHDA